MEIVTLILFCTVLFVCIATGIPILAALAAGYAIFFIYSLIKGFSPLDILKMSFKGVKTVKNILITFMLIGIITALWRAGGTIPAIVHYASGIMEPRVFFLVTFLLNCLISVLTGTAFGTAATMGAICMTMAYTAGINPIITGGAVVSGAFFGDRCSPVSTSALLVAQITGTNIYSNIVGMIKTVIVPFCITCVVYLIPGFILTSQGMEIQSVSGIFSEEFNITPIAVIPAVVILVLSLFRVNVKLNMLVSIAASVMVCIFCSEMSLLEIVRCAFAGYFSSDPMLSKMIDGGGIVSMLRVAAIVCISSCYSGIFEGTGLLGPVKRMTDKAEKRISGYAVTMITSVITSIVACNQTLAIMLTDQLCGHMEKDKKRFALYLENSAVVIAPLVPWSIAGSVPITSSGAPAVSLAAAVLLYLIPLCSLFIFRKIKTQV